MRDAVTTALDVLGLLVVAAGVFLGLQRFIGGAALIPAGGVVLVVSAFWASRPRGEQP